MSASWIRAYAQGHWGLVVQLIETTPEATRTPSHWLHLARSREKLGQLVEAFGAYERLRELAPAKLGVSGWKDLQRQAEAEAEALAQRIPWAEIELGGGVPAGAFVFVDQQWLEPGRMRSPYPVNPGWHTFLLESYGDVQAAQRVFFEEGQTRPVVLHRGGGSGLDAGLTGSLGGPERARLSWRTLAGTTAAEDAHRERLLTASYISLGAGALGVIVGTGFTISAVGKRNQLIDLGDDCRNSTCFVSGSEVERADQLQRELRSANDVANVSFALGGVGLVAGGVLFLMQRQPDAKPTQLAGVELSPLVGVKAAGLAGRF